MQTPSVGLLLKLQLLEHQHWLFGADRRPAIGKKLASRPGEPASRSRGLQSGRKLLPLRIIHSSQPTHSRTESGLLEQGRSAWIACPVNHWKSAMFASVPKIAPAAVILLAAMGLGGCATKSYVREQIAPVSQRVDALEAKLNETDGTAKSALSQAQAASGQAQNNGQRLDQLNARVDGIEQRMQENQKKRPRN
jgi:outer membrane murein-binding lipoprotein Lpp